uniref:Ground-like domain-containing protein n=1 Tax=Syphacia muris TaxID=451379 RepID=A0A0N5ANX3_9BILA
PLKKRKAVNYFRYLQFFQGIITNTFFHSILFAIIKDNVTESKRQIIRLLESNFNAIKFDVICVEGVFSYLVHSKNYCEITKYDITCLVFR